MAQNGNQYVHLSGYSAKLYSINVVKQIRISNFALSYRWLRIALVAIAHPDCMLRHISRHYAIIISAFAYYTIIRNVCESATVTPHAGRVVHYVAIWLFSLKH
jgi:hypothetical protein